MRIALSTIGSRGDVQPFVLLGSALRARGHDVWVATGAEFETLVKQADLGFRQLGSFGDGYASEVLTHPKVQEALRRGPSIYRMAMAAPRPSAAEQQAFTDAMVSSADGADLVVNTTLTRIGALARPGVPWCSVSAWPVTETAAWPALGAPDLALGGMYNRFTHRAMGTLEWLVYRASVNRARRAVGLPTAGLRSPFRDDGHTRPILYQFSPHVFAPPPDWPEHCHVTGYWSDNVRWEQSAELTRFVDGGPAPLVASFGSAWLPCGADLLRATVAAARTTGHRLVIIGGPEADLPGDMDVIRSETADFTWLLPRAAAVLHHGGQGTTAAVVSAGVAQVVVPCFADQPLWARRMQALGVAAPPVPYAGLTGERLAAAVRTAVADAEIATRARSLAEAVRGEQGVETAADVIEAYAARVC
ncbi:glycosyltransferase [Nocardia terpenica]|uniref:Glucosyl transferase n=1 Tax=Nocardia terpenica TaxID=455432 RepID=A0A291RLP8_9NOCA|nr:glycosyltransferase [Nocardia terpenica]ATL68228.1 glucosyl transferase [Nocardia terpenica]